MVNPIILKRLRKARDWSQADLASQSKIDKQTISRIERGKRTSVRRHTEQSLCKALGVDRDMLAGTSPIEPADTPTNQSLVNVWFGGAARNALTLVANRFGVREDSIVELAPFLFAWAAETSLRRRTELLDALERHVSELQDMQAGFPHLDPRMTWWSDFDSVAGEERKNIAARDIFAAKMPGDDFEPGIAEDFDQAKGPIVRLLQELAAQIGPDTVFESWDPDGGPDYAICYGEAAAMFGGDKNLANEVIKGTVCLDDMPPKLRNPSRMAERIAWARQEVEEAAKRDEYLRNLTLDELMEVQPK